VVRSLSSDIGRSTVSSEVRADAGRTRGELKNDSLRLRYTYKLLSNLVGLPIGLVSQAIIPRLLGPSAYGNFGFLSSFFNSIFGFFDSGASSAFYTKLSQRLHEAGIIRFYWAFVAGVVLVVGILVSIVLVAGYGSWVWPESKAELILLALVFGAITWSTQIITKIVDAYGLSVRGETVRMWQKVFSLALLFLLFFFEIKSLTIFFLYQYVILLVLCWAWAKILQDNKVEFLSRRKLTTTELRSYSREFYHYSSPLFTYSLFAVIAGILDRWLLQRFAGSVQQGFYSLSSQIATICFVFTSAMTPLFMREMSIAFGNKDIDSMQRMFKKYVPLLFAVACAISVFFFFEATKISYVMGGQRYMEAGLAISIMSLYPMHQTYGQLNEAVLLATGQTKLYRNVSIVVALIGLPLTLWLIAPADLFGMSLGATGLAIKMVVIQFLAVNIELWFNTRYLKMSFLMLVRHQLYCLVVLGGATWLVCGIVDTLVKDPILALVISGTAYAAVCFGILRFFPSIFSISLKEVREQLFSIKGVFVR
jgi:O-antigen/teichoic acid export membrane protein